MMRRFITLLLLLPLLSAAQPAITFDPDSILVGDAGQTQVLLVGAFHFDYPGRDDHKTAKEDEIDVLIGRRAEEVAELNAYLARFRPTKIVVERDAGSSVNENYRRYLTGNFELTRDEIHQIAFRLGKQFGIDSLIPGDADNLASDWYDGPDSTLLRPLLDRLYDAPTPGGDTSVTAKYFELYTHDDKLRKAHTLLEDFRYMNSPKRILRGHGHYLEFLPDAVAIGWYSRNLRIYHNIRKIPTSPDDRVLVLFGAGHLGILRQQFQSSPRYQLVEFDGLSGE